MDEKEASPTEASDRGQSKYARKILPHALQCFSTLMLPLLFGVFTIIITIHQQNVARQQRIEDQSDARVQRKQEWDIAMLQREMERENNLDRHRDEVLATYIREIDDLLERKNGSLTAHPLTAALARSKTLSVLRRLDTARQIQVLRSLYDAKQLTQSKEHNPVDISSAELTNMDFRTSTMSKVLENISFVGIYLRNCTFSQLELKHVNFSFARLENVNFAFVKHDVPVRLPNDRKIHDVDFSFATLINVSFSASDLDGINFSFARLTNVSFSGAMLLDVNFSTAQPLNNLDFSDASVVQVNFSYARLYDNDFSWADLSNVYFASAIVKSTNFASARFGYCKSFGYMKEGTVNFSSTKLENAIFSFARFARHSTEFHHCTLPSALCVRSDCQTVQFNGCDLSSSVFWHAHANRIHFHHSDLTNVNFSLANLPDADFTTAIVTDQQLQSALSIRDATLPNGTLGLPRNLLRNGDANCRAEHWQILSGSVAVIRSDADPSQCRFVLQSNSVGAVMKQRVDLASVWDSSIWTLSSVTFKADPSDGVSIELRARSGSGTTIDWTDFGAAMGFYQLREGMDELEALVTFVARTDDRNIGSVWCENVTLFIGYGKGPF